MESVYICITQFLGSIQLLLFISSSSSPSSLFPTPLTYPALRSQGSSANFLAMTYLFLPLINPMFCHCMPPLDIVQPHSILLHFIFIFLSLLVSLLPLRFSSSIHFGIQVNISLGCYKETGVCIRLKLYNARKSKFEFYDYNNLSSFNYRQGLYLTL